MPVGRWDTTSLLRPLAIVAAAAVLSVVLIRSPHISTAHAAGGAPWTVYVVDNSSSGAVFPVPTDTNSPGAAIPVGGFPTAIAVTPDGSVAWVVNGDAGELQKITTSNNKPGATIPGVGVNPFGGAVAISPDGTTAFVAGEGPGFAVNLTSGTVTSLPSGLNSTAVAVTPDGKTVYVGGGIGSTASIQALRAQPPFTSLLTSPIQLQGNGNSIGAIAVTPDGKTVYAVTNPDVDPPSVIPITTSTNAAGNPIQVGVRNDKADAIAITPDGTTAFVTFRLNSIVAPVTLTPGGGSAQTAVPVGNGLLTSGVAVTPDGKSLYVTATPNPYGSPTLFVLDTSNLNSQKTISPAGGTNPFALAITPDQAPVASLTATPVVAGQPTAFNASASTVKFGIITDFAWNFGDGSPVVHTSTPTISHVYAAPGPHNPSVTETDSAGTSLSRVFTGQTMLRNGGPSAQRMISINIPPATSTTNPTTGSTTNPTTGTTTNPTTGTTTNPTTGSTTTTTAVSPTISLSPTVGPPGAVVGVTGSGFPANTQLTLAWQPGIGTFQAMTDSSGGLRTSVLVFPHDQLGATQLVAQITPPTSAASAAFLVVQSPGEPGGSGALVLYRR
jgi:DNA-binding beta-propeller fold protein YncE